MEAIRIAMLLNELDCDVTTLEITIEDTVIVDTDEYKVLNEAEANEEFYEYQRMLFDDCGFDCFSEWAKRNILEDYVDKEPFEEMYDEYIENYVYDLNDGELENYYNDYEVCSRDELIEVLKENDNGIDWYIANFGQDEFEKYIVDNDCLDFESVVDFIIEHDGRGALATYDGWEMNLGESYGEDFYAYKIG